MSRILKKLMMAGLMETGSPNKYAKRPLCVTCKGCGEKTKKSLRHFLPANDGNCASGFVNLCPACYDAALAAEGYKSHHGRVLKHPKTGARRFAAMEPVR